MRAALLAALLLAVAPAQPVAAGEDDAEEAVCRTHVEAPPETVWDVLSDLASWPERAPDLATIELAEGADGAPRVRQTTRVLGLSFFYVARVSVDAARRRIELALDPSEQGDFEHLDSTWSLTPAEGGGTLVELRSRGRLARPLPGFLQRRGLQTTVDAMVESLVGTMAHRAPVLPPVGAR